VANDILRRGLRALEMDTIQQHLLRLEEALEADRKEVYGWVPSRTAGCRGGLAGKQAEFAVCCQKGALGVARKQRNSKGRNCSKDREWY